MKSKLIFSAAALMLCFSLTSCASETDVSVQSESAAETAIGSATAEETSAPTASGSIDNKAAHKLRLTVDGRQISVTLYDTPAANALYDMLPLELDFEDYNGIEKISYLRDKLPTDGEPDGCDPNVGDLCLYAPWGNLSIFYKDFRYSDSLILLGHTDGDMDVISGMTGGFRATLEKQN